jgi:dolichol-phosphate mannosyltransferase
MDSTLLFFWLGCLLSIGMALLKNRPIGWYFAGIALGSAMLTKYTAIFLVAGTVLVLVTHRPWRKHLLSIHPWLGAVIAAGMFSPVILWNAHNDWASFRFQFIDRFGNDTIGFLNPAGFAIIQFLVLTPPVLVVCAGMIARWFRNRRFTNETLFAMAFSLPLLATMAYKSLTAEVHLNWTAPAFLSLIPAISAIIAAGYTHANLSTRIEAFGQWMRWSGIACILVNCGILLFLLVLQPHLRWISAFGPWTDLAHAVEDSEDALEHQTHQEPLIIADGRYRLASVLAFYRTPVENYVEASQFTTSQWILGGRGVGYEFWSDRNDWIGANCLYITDDTHMLADLSRWFDRVEPVDDPRLNNGKAHYMAWCFGLKAQPRKSIQ